MRQRQPMVVQLWTLSKQREGWRGLSCPSVASLRWREAGRKLLPFSRHDPQLRLCWSQIARKERWRSRQTIFALMCFLFRTDVCQTADRWPGRCLVHPPPLLHHHSITSTSSRELIDLRAACQGWSGSRRQLDTQLPAMYRCMLPRLHFHLQGKTP